MAQSLMKINVCCVCKLAMLNMNVGFYFALAHKIEFYEKSTWNFSFNGIQYYVLAV